MYLNLDLPPCTWICLLRLGGLRKPPKLKTIDENKAIGIDLGIKTFAVLSNGEEIQNPIHLIVTGKQIGRAHV